jgi:hypothetical protein
MENLSRPTIDLTSKATIKMHPSQPYKQKARNDSCYGFGFSSN